jgi:membrane protease YdiL (CAAX protease family)
MTIHWQHSPPLRADDLRAAVAARAAPPEDSTPPETSDPEAYTLHFQRLTRRLFPPEVIAVVYALALLVVELLTAFVDPILGLAGHALLIFALYLGASLLWEKPLYRLLIALVLPSVVRVLSFALLLVPLERPLALALIGVPLFATAYAGYQALGFARPMVGLTGRDWPLQVLIALSGPGVGALFYALLRPEPLALSADSTPLIGAAAVLIVSGLIEEFIFRGLLQRAAVNVLRWPGQVFAAAVYALMHLALGPLAMLLALLTGLMYGWLARRSRSVLGVGLSRGIANGCALLLFPLLFT